MQTAHSPLSWHVARVISRRDKRPQILSSRYPRETGQGLLPQRKCARNQREYLTNMLSEVLRRDTLSQAGRARAAKNKPQSDAVWSLVGDSVFALLVASSVAWGLASIAVWKSNLRRVR